MFPGSELQQIKDINSKIERAVQLVNLTITTHSMKKRTYKQLLEDDSDCCSEQSYVPKKPRNKKLKVNAQEGLIMETLAIDMIQPTMQIAQPQTSEGEAFSIKVVCDQKAVKQLAKTLKLDKIFA